jgi:hypothetical protein
VLEARVDGNIFICTDKHFGGDCTNYAFFDDQCSNFPGEFNDDISSFFSCFETKSFILKTKENL